MPSNWQVQGYGTPYYKNLGYIFQKDWPKVMNEPPKDWTAYDERNPVGSYRRTFTVPAAWEGAGRPFLKFDGVDAGFFLWINGHKVGYSQNSRNAAEFDVTKYLQPGENTVAVEVYRFTAGSYFEDQDMWRLSGIFRNVTLWSAPKLHIQDTFVTTDLDSAYRDATLKVVAKLHNYGTTATKAQALTTTLYDASGKPVGKPLRGSVPSIAPGSEKSVTLSGGVSNPKKWTAETPNLYTAVLRLGGEEILSHRVGFRKVEIKGRVFMVNGKPVKLKGANRHEMSPGDGPLCDRGRHGPRPHDAQAGELQPRSHLALLRRPALVRAFATSGGSTSSPRRTSSATAGTTSSTASRVSSGWSWTGTSRTSRT